MLEASPMFEVSHLDAGAAERLKLVIDARDAFDLLDRIVHALGARLLAYCFMHTRLHLVVEGPVELVVRLTTEALVAYTRSFNARHGFSGQLLRGPVLAIPKRTPFELKRLIDYVHENPCATKPPVVQLPVHFEWSSARPFAGLSLAPFPNVARARELLGKERLRLRRPAPAGLEPVCVSTVHPTEILVAAAQAYGVDPSLVMGKSRETAVVAARRLFVVLGSLESYDCVQLAPFLGVTRQRTWQMGREGACEGAVRIGRTLVREPLLLERVRRWAATLPAVKSEPSSASRGA